jgi:aspartate aminotransferase
MTVQLLSGRLQRAFAVKADLLRFDTESTWARRRTEIGALDFVEGNPREVPPAGFVEALRARLEPRDPSWYGYMTNASASRAVVAAALRERRDVAFEERDIFLTNGAFAGLVIALTAIVDPGEEVLYVTPAWFWYDSIVLMAGGIPVPVPAMAPAWDLDVDAIRAAITERTRAIVVNSPHNPSGRIYPAEQLRRLAAVLTDASRGRERPIFLISDEAYCRVLFDGRSYVSPTAFYPRSFLVYTYTKTLLAPGQRIGYVALPPDMPEPDAVRASVRWAQTMTGWAFPNALLQHALPELERLSLDLAHYQAKRDRMVESLGAMGYEMNAPEATYYLLVRSPLADDQAFVEQLAQLGVFVLPGSHMRAPGTFRVSLTASMEMIERSLPGFALAADGTAI